MSWDFTPAHPTPHTPHAPGRRGTSSNVALLSHVQFPEASVVAVHGILSRKLETMIMARDLFPTLRLSGELSPVPSGACWGALLWGPCCGGPALGVGEK